MDDVFQNPWRFLSRDMNSPGANRQTPVSDQSASAETCFDSLDATQNPFYLNPRVTTRPAPKGAPNSYTAAYQ